MRLLSHNYENRIHFTFKPFYHKNYEKWMKITWIIETRNKKNHHDNYLFNTLNLVEHFSLELGFQRVCSFP